MKIKKFMVIFKTKIQASRGFSLVEILIALTLLAIAGTFVATKIFDQLEEGKRNAATIQMGHIASALKEFRRHCGFYPTSDQGLAALLEKPTGKECKRYNTNGYIDGESIPVDPWDYDYMYESSDGKKFKLFSYGGPDGDTGDQNMHLIFGKKNR